MHHPHLGQESLIVVGAHAPVPWMLLHEALVPHSASIDDGLQISAQYLVLVEESWRAHWGVAVAAHPHLLET
jgi:hypothetical protein